jgi:PAS domain S-box-containing protein
MGEPVDLDEVSVDMARYADPEMQEAAAVYLETHKTQWKPDLVVAIAAPAATFVAKHRNRLFPDIPVLYLTADPRLLVPGALDKNAAYVGQKLDIPGLFEDILQVAPATKNIEIVVGATPFERTWQEMIQKAAEPLTGRIKFTYYSDLSFEQMQARVATLPPDSFIFFLTLLRDARGVTHSAEAVLRRLAPLSNAPINSIFAHQMGLGIVGGRLYPGELVGKEGARVAVRILHGEPASSFPPKLIERLGPQYDWRALRRWKISESRLPPGSTVLFREPSIWERYWKAITGTILFCLLQAGLIVSLLVNRARRRRGEEEAKLVASISSKFVNLPPSEVDREIGDAQRRIFEVLDLDVSGFWRWSDDDAGFFRLTHYSRNGEGPQLPERMNSREYFPWYQHQVLAGWTIAIRSMKELPPEAARDRETFRQFGFKSNLTIPLSVGGEPPIGALGFNTTRAERDWPDALVKQLQLVAQIFANALARQRTDEILRESEARFRTVANTAPVMIWMSGLEKEGIFFNKRWLEFTGRTLDQELGEGWLKGVHAGDLAHTLEVCGTAFGKRQPFTTEYRLRRKDGEYRWMLDTGTPRFDANGIFLGYIGSCIDIGERKQAELDHQLQTVELARVGRLALMGELAASLAHEVNNPLCAMVTNASAAQRMLANDKLGMEEFHELLGDIVSDGHRAREVIDGIHNMVRKGEAAHAPVSLSELIRDALRIVRADAVARHVSLSAEVGPDAGVVIGNRVQLLQVLLNLTLNAFEALTDVRFEARRVIIRANRVQGEMVHVSVRDSGPGFQHRMAEQLFQPFFSTKAEGTGMGLAIARRIIEAHGGTLLAENCADGGALFTISLPKASEVRSATT